MDRAWKSWTYCYRDKVWAGPDTKKRQVGVSTFKKWQSQYEREHQSLSWLRCDVDKANRKLVGLLWCEACQKHETELKGLKNFTRAWIEDPAVTRLATSSTNDQHRAYMIRMHAVAAKATNQSITTYSPIACALLTMDRTVKERIIKKFDICFVMAKEGLAFRKYPSLHELEAHHGVDLGFSYKTKNSAEAFTHYIARSQRQLFVQSVSAVSFYSILMDGSILMLEM